MAQKPQLHLHKMTGDPAQNVEALANLYERLTGKKMTPEELARALAREKSELAAPPQK